MNMDNFRASLEWLIETGDADWGLRLGAALFRFWEMREYLAEGRNSLGKLLQASRSGRSDESPSPRAFCRRRAGRRNREIMPGGGRVDWQRAWRLTRGLGDKQGVAVSLNALAVVARDRGEMQLRAH